MIRQPGMKPALRQVEQARQQLALRQIAGGAHQDDDLRIFRTNPWANFFQCLLLSWQPNPEAHDPSVGPIGLPNR